MNYHTFLLLTCAVLSTAFPAAPKDNTDDNYVEMVEKYLRNFYGLKTTDQVGRNKNNAFTEKLKQMQRFFKLEVTGQLDYKTVEVMQKSRCGVMDIGEYNAVPKSVAWPKTDLTYRIVNYTPDMSRANVEYSIQRAFKIWSDVTPLTFTRVSKGDCDIEILFISGDHKDNSPFDGPGGILAHAFQPGNGIGGDTHFDESESFTTDSQEYNLFLVAAHEFGHSLGLSHSNDLGALMYPHYQNTDPKEFRLPQDDIDAIQALYGSSRNVSQHPGPRTPSKCDQNTRFDAVVTLRGELIFFINRFIWRKPAAHPVVLLFVQEFWGNLPSNVDAAYENPNTGEIRIFKGSKYWTIQDRNVLSVKSITQLGFPLQVKKIDAAVHVDDLGKTFFFVGNKYWSYDEERHAMETRHPMAIESEFPGMQPKIDAAVYFHDKLYFFKGTSQYEYNTSSKRIERIINSNYWLGC